MNEQRPQSPGEPSLAAAEAQVNRMRQAMADQQARLARGSQLTAIIGGALCLLMAGYFGYFYLEMRKVLNPKTIIGAAENELVNMLPDARKTLETQINGSADEWATQLSTELQARMPETRADLEKFIENRIDQELDKIRVLSGDQFRNFVRENRPQLADGFNSLRDPDKAKEFVANLSVVVEKELEGDARAQAEELLATIIQLNHKLAVLQKGEHLDNEQALEREILMMARRLQVETAVETPPRRRASPAVQESGTQRPEDATPSPQAESEEASAAPAADGDSAKKAAADE